MIVVFLVCCHISHMIHYPHRNKLMSFITFSKDEAGLKDVEIISLIKKNPGPALGSVTHFRQADNQPPKPLKKNGGEEAEENEDAVEQVQWMCSSLHENEWNQSDGPVCGQRKLKMMSVVLMKCLHVIHCLTIVSLK